MLLEEIKEIALSNEVVDRCPVEVGTRKNIENLFDDNPAAGTEKLCKKCPWRINAPDYLNCSLIAAKFGPYPLNEVAEMEGIPRNQIEKIENNGTRRLVKIVRLNPVFKPLKEYIKKKFNLPNGW